MSFWTFSFSEATSVVFVSSLSLDEVCAYELGVKPISEGLGLGSGRLALNRMSFTDAIIDWLGKVEAEML